MSRSWLCNVAPQYLAGKMLNVEASLNDEYDVCLLIKHYKVTNSNSKFRMSKRKNAMS